MSNAQDMFDTLAEELVVTRPNVTRRKLFGVPSLMVNGNAFLAFQRDALICKLAEDEQARALAVPGAQVWSPSNSGRPMRGWIELPATQTAVWEEYAEAALAYVATLPPK